MLTGCGTLISHTENSNQSAPKEKAHLSLKMKRSACNGRCPVYDLTVQPDGEIIFEGKNWTKTIGKATDKLNEKQLENLVSEIEQSDFFSLENVYDWDSGNCTELASDMPNVNLTINLNGKEKTINHYHGCFEKDNSSAGKTKSISDKIFPQQLYKLENKIDEIIGTRRWIGERK